MKRTGALIATAAVLLVSNCQESAAQQGREECPQGRQIRLHKSYPASLTDCEVLDADTADENRKLQRRPANSGAPLVRSGGVAIKATSSPKENIDPNSLVVELSVKATSVNPPVVTGSTNLPNGTVLSIVMLGEPPGCVPHCGIGPADAVVQDGRFTIGKTLTGEEPLLSAFYTIDVTMFSKGQPEAVLTVIGPKGERLRGPHVATLGEKPGTGYIPVNFPRSSPPSEWERLMGLAIHDTERVFISSDPAFDKLKRAREVSKDREQNAKNCAFVTDFVNAAIRLGKVTGTEVLGEERQAKINECISRNEVRLQAALAAAPASGQAGIKVAAPFGPSAKSYSEVAVTPCTALLNAWGTSKISELSDPLIDNVGLRDGGLGSGMNVLSYVVTECRLNEGKAIGQAVDSLFEQKRRGRLPQIPIGGTTNEAYNQAVWVPFEKWVRHQGPRPDFSKSTDQ